MGKLIGWVTAAVVVALAGPLLAGLVLVTVIAPATPALAACPTRPAGGAWVIPFAQDYTVTSEYGWRKHPVTGVWRLHTGIDLAATTKPGRVLAASAGTVHSAGPLGGYGTAVIIDHGGGITTLYGHLAGTDPTITPGTPITAGALLGVEGATGTATGIHLHFEVRLDGTPVNPRTWMHEVHGLDFTGHPPPAGDAGVRHYDIGPVLPATQYLADTLGTLFGITTIYGWRPTDPYPDHPSGRAADFMVYRDRGLGDRLAGYAQTHAAALSIDYIIWYQRIWSVERASEGWRPMPDRGGDTANHKDHVHITITPGGPTPPGDDGGGVGCGFLGGVLSQDNLAAGAGAGRGSELAGWAYEVAWAEVNPSVGVWDTTGLTQAISYATAHGQRIRLRIPGADTAPAYVKAMGGGPVPFRDHDHDRDTTIARVWDPGVQAAWRDLMTHLAAAVNGDPAVGEVQIGGAGLITPETMLLMGGERTRDGVRNADHLRRAGLTDEIRESVWRADVAMMSEVWAGTALTLWCHPWQTLDGRSSLATTFALIEDARAINPRIVFGHTGTDQATIEGTTPISALYQYLTDRGYPMALQTRSLAGGYDGGHPVGDLNTILTWAASHGVMSLELPRGWETRVDPAVLAAANTAMTATALYGPTPTPLTAQPPHRPARAGLRLPVAS